MDRRRERCLAAVARLVIAPQFDDDFPGVVEELLGRRRASRQRGALSWSFRRPSGVSNTCLVRRPWSAPTATQPESSSGRSTRVIVLDEGKVRADGPPDVVLGNRELMDRHGLEVPLRLQVKTAKS